MVWFQMCQTEEITVQLLGFIASFCLDAKFSVNYTHTCTFIYILQKFY